MGEAGADFIEEPIMQDLHDQPRLQPQLQTPQSAPPQEFSVPQQEYLSLLPRYTVLTERVRAAERLMRSTDSVRVLEQQRHNLHNEIAKAGQLLGKDRDAVALDLMLDGGNLQEYGLPQTPVIKLPMSSFMLDYEDLGVSYVIHPKRSDGSDTYQLAEEVLSDPDGNLVAAKSRESGGSAITITGDEGELRKYQGGDYALIVFAQESKAKKIAQFDTRVERMRNTARKFDLNLYKGQYGHPPFGQAIYGVEVQKDQIAGVATAMRENPAEYWLTPQELQQPAKTA